MPSDDFLSRYPDLLRPEAVAGGSDGRPGRGEGLRVRFKRIPGETPKDVLRRPLILPAALGAFGWTEEFLHSDYDTVRAGQFSQPAMGPATARQLRTIDDIETLTVEWDPVWLVQSGQDPAEVRRNLYALGRSRKPAELLATLQFGSEAPLLRLSVTVRSIAAVLKEGEPDSIYYTLRLEEWRNATGKRRGEGKGGSRLPTTHRLKAGDTLSSLAQHYYHSHKHWKTIAKANGIRDFGSSTALVKHRRFKVGSKIKIPKVS